ncbi:hypothetical protein [Alloactinosynnema sp. L-07]|nr:hypothetical protein [Alloactinosynnema sp. L-07]
MIRSVTAAPEAIDTHQLDAILSTAVPVHVRYRIEVVPPT